MAKNGSCETRRNTTAESDTKLACVRKVAFRILRHVAVDELMAHFIYGELAHGVGYLSEGICYYHSRIVGDNVHG